MKTTEGESSTVTPKEPAKQSAAKSTRQTATTKKDTRPKSPTSVQSAKMETPVTASAAACAKELLVSAPKIDAMTAIAKQAVANLKKREVGVKFKEPSAKPKKEKPPAPKRHQHPVPSKGKSAFVGKGKATAPAKKPVEVITVSVQDVLASLLPAVTSSQPTAVSELKPITTTVADTVKTDTKPEESTKETQAQELPPVTDVRPDLELSEDSEAAEIHGVLIIDLDTNLDAEKPFIEFSDVEPDYTAEELAACAQTSDHHSDLTGNTVRVPGCSSHLRRRDSSHFRSFNNGAFQAECDIAGRRRPINSY